ncbi:DUF2889 domain-containing protein [Desulfatiglans anilini]|uniref:DUF2889 domain-containing protein n=1 Tax=Desulfatiglans anilini TaxID=90728 RepID=UPI00047FA08D|nr:DUF2889 domain-containing protein [Desulfatiglans anilini]
MGALKELARGNAVHQRRLEFKSYPLGQGRVLVEGSLRDDRFQPGFYFDGVQAPEGVIHWMIVRMIVEGRPLTITDIEAEMPGVPHELCTEAIGSVERMKGVAISGGYSREVIRLMGGIRGCSHLTHLMIAMGPAALHGYWTDQSRERRPLPNSLGEIPALRQLRNSCFLWRDDGPFMDKVRQVVQEAGKKGSRPG